MNPRYIRSSNPNQRRRNLGDQPDIGPVARIPGAGKRLENSKRKGRRTKRTPHHLQDRRRIRQMKARKFAITFWLSIILTGCFVTLGVVSVLWLRAQSDRRQIAPRFTTVETLPALSITNFTPPTEREALAIIRNAIAARDEESLLEFVHQNEEIPLGEMLAFFANTEERDGMLSNRQWIGSSDTATRQIQSMIVAFDNGGLPSHRIAMLTPTSSGVWKIDFPSYARWCDPPIHLMEQAGGYPGGRVRAFLSPDHYFNGPFADDRSWICFLVSSPDVSSTVFAYCRIDSPEHQALMEAFTPGIRQIRATFEIQRVEGAQDRQFLITSVVSSDWMAEEFVSDSN